MLQSLFKPRPAKAQGRALYGAVVEKARDAAFYRSLGVPDRIDARFELYTLHLALVMERLRDAGEQAQEVSQETLDAYVRSLDEVLRQQGVGDLSMAKKMKKLAGVVVGRATIVGEAVRKADTATIAAVLGRQIPELSEQQASALAAYAVSAHESLAAQPLPEILAGKPAWPQVSA